MNNGTPILTNVLGSLKLSSNSINKLEKKSENGSLPLLTNDEYQDKIIQMEEEKR